jgi:hypothetical protein
MCQPRCRRGTEAERIAAMEHMMGYAGSWTDGSRTTIALVAGTDQQPSAELYSTAQRAPVVYVRHSSEEINATADRLEENLEAIARRGIRFVSGERDIMGNRVRVGLVDPTPDEIAYIESLGPAITVEDAEPAGP